MFLPCSFICCVFLCLPILLNLLCLVCPFHRLQVHSSCCFWCLSPVAKVGSVGCVGFLVEGTVACVLVDEAGSYLFGGQDHVQWCVRGVWDLIMILGSLSANGWGCVPVLLVVWHRVSSTVACWSLSGAGSSVEVEVSGRAFAFWYYVEWEVSGGPMSWTRLSQFRGTDLTHGSEEKGEKKKERKNKIK